MLIQSIRSSFLGAVVAVILLITGAPMVSAQQAGEIIPGRFIVTFHNGVPPGLTASNLARSHGLRILHIYEHTFSGMAIQVGTERAAGVLSSLRGDVRVNSIGNDHYSSIVAQSYPEGLNRIDGTGATAGSHNDGSGIDVAVVDTGVDTDHSDLAGRIDLVRSRSCLTTGEVAGCRGVNADSSLAFEDDHGHGTFVSGIIAANDNDEGIVGVAPMATIIAIKVCDAEGLCPDADITAGIDYLASLYTSGDPVEVTNISLGGPCGGPCDETTDPLLQATHTAISGLVGLGTTVVVAAGNESTDAANVSPAAHDAVVTASALADWDGEPGGNGGSMIFIGSGRWSDDSFAKFSNYGVPIDVIAPGVLNISLALGGGTTSSSGTSFSSPHAAGVAAVFTRDYMDNHLGVKPSPVLVKQALIETGECHEGDGTVIHNGIGCAEIWPGDPDGIGEPMVRADNVVNFTPSVVLDVAITSITVDTLPILDGDLNTVTVGVTNNGSSGTGEFDVSLLDDLALVGTPLGVTLTAGESTDVVFNWTPSGAGDHDLEASHDFMDDDSSNDSATLTVNVQTPIHDVAVLSVSAPASVSQGIPVDVLVEVKNEGTYDESFNVTLTDLTAGMDIGMQPVDALTPGTTTTLNFNWNTAGTSLEVHTLSAVHDFVDDDLSNDSAQTTSEVTEPVVGPSVTSITPHSMVAADSPVSVTIDGSGFGSDATVTFQNGSGPTPVATVISVTDTVIMATVSVKVKGKKGLSTWDVVVTNSSGSDVLLGSFTITR
ncbi:MAG: S8 family serine peptidase [Amphritea sp.]